MSILIRGMEMPKNCGECPFATPTRDGLMCDAVSFLAKCLAHPISRMSCCPLIELSPHGRLIDADSLLKDGWCLYKQVMRKDGYAIHEMSLNCPSLPIVIEAEE